MDPRTNVLDKDAQPIRRRGRILGILVIAIVAVAITKLVAFRSNGSDWVFARRAIVYGLMAGLPFLLARIAPKAAEFDRQWLPSARLHWVSFLGMLFLLFVGGGIGAWLAGAPELPSWLSQEEHYRAHVDAHAWEHKPATIVVFGVFMILIGPIAEEIFWRAYLLEQLRKLTYGSVALLGQSLLFALSHYGLLDRGVLWLVPVFWYGIVFGMWRIRFRSVLPLMLAHVILNAVALGPSLKDMYDRSADLWSRPELRQIDLLTGEPISKAVPAIITFLGDPDEDVSLYATQTLVARYGGDAEPYLKEALASSDAQIINGVLFVIDMTRLSGLRQDVRKVAWSAKDRSSQLAATLTLYRLRDAEGLWEISQRHPDEIVRRTAERCLASGSDDSPE